MARCSIASAIAVGAVISHPPTLTAAELGSGRFALPIECETADEIEQLLKGDLGELYFEITTNSTCKSMENFTDTAFRLERCAGPAAEVTFLTWDGKPDRQIWVAVKSIYAFIDTREARNSCMAGAVDWAVAQ